MKKLAVALVLVLAGCGGGSSSTAFGPASPEGPVNGVSEEKLAKAYALRVELESMGEADMPALRRRAAVEQDPDLRAILERAIGNDETLVEDSALRD